MKDSDLTSEKLQQYLWEALQDFRAGKMTAKELKALTNTAGKIVQIALLDIMSDNAIGKNENTNLLEEKA